MYSVMGALPAIGIEMLNSLLKRLLDHSDLMAGN